ncbi:MAG: hypothetical protein SNJ82_09725 [Gemmataceae bacterium]
MNAYQYIRVEPHADVSCIRLVQTSLQEPQMLALGQELLHLARQVSKLVLILGPERLNLLYSVFLTKLIRVRNEARRQGGELVLCEANSITLSVFEAACLDREFVFRPTLADALAYWHD